MIKIFDIYLASPFFNDEQVERVERVKKILESKGLKVYSPKDELVCEENPTIETAKNVFNENCRIIKECTYLLAITDGKDVGTIWEAGYAYANNKKIIYYCETLGDKPFNLMLAQSANLVIRSVFELESDWVNLINLDIDYIWTGAIE